MRRFPPTNKIGTGHLSAWLRQGLREGRALLYTESNIAQQPELGLFGTQTPGEIQASRRMDLEPDPDMDLDRD
jgi:hypothetical protein